jgi:large conductance mechanosensitive channel
MEHSPFLLNLFPINQYYTIKMGFIKEFKDFAMKGNLVDIAVGFVMGAAFNKVVSSFTGGIVSPLVGLLFQSDFNDLKYTIKEGTMNDAGETVGEITVMYGEFLTNVIDFLIVAFVMFMIVKGVNKMKKKEEPAPEAPKGPTQEELLAEIRDLLKKQ